MSRYWHHHPYTEQDRAAGIRQPRNFGALAAPETYDDFRFYMANLLLSREDEIVPFWVENYWTRHPINRDRDERYIRITFSRILDERRIRGFFSEFVQIYPRPAV